MAEQRSDTEWTIGVCPECDAEVPIQATPKVGSELRCPNCRSSLVIIGLAPIELDWAFELPFDEPMTASRR